MTGVILGGVLGYGLPIIAFLIFRWADRTFVGGPAALPAREPAAQGRLIHA